MRKQLVSLPPDNLLEVFESGHVETLVTSYQSRFLRHLTSTQLRTNTTYISQSQSYQDFNPSTRCHQCTISPLPLWRTRGVRAPDCEGRQTHHGGRDGGQRGGRRLTGGPFTTDCLRNTWQWAENLELQTLRLNLYSLVIQSYPVCSFSVVNHGLNSLRKMLYSQLQ